MGFSRNISSLNIIQGLSDLPNQDDNLTSDQLKAKFDEGVNILKQYVFSFLDELEDTAAAGKIGYNGDQPTVGEALAALEAAGSGTVPPDNTISTDKLQDTAVTEAKLATAVATKLNALNVKFGKITPTYTGESSTDEGASGYITTNKWQEFDIGVSPSVVILFSDSQRHESSHNDCGINFGYDYTGSSTKIKYRYGGIATSSAACMCDSYEVFEIDGSKIKTHKFEYNPQHGDRYYLGDIDKLYYIAIMQ